MSRSHRRRRSGDTGTRNSEVGVMSKSLGSVLIGLLAGWSTVASAIPVSFVDPSGRQWADLNATTRGSSWYAGADLCPTDGIGTCAGALEGWTWATRDQVVELFEELTGLSSAFFRDAAYFEEGSAWAPAAMDRMRPNFVGVFHPFQDIYGITATRADGTKCSYIRLPLPGEVADERCAYAAGIEDWYGARTDAIWAAQLLEPGRSNLEGADPEAGLFLFRVPEPGTFALFGMGLLGMGLSRRVVSPR